MHILDLMHVKTQGILLQAVKHHETAMVLKLFTRDKGLITCFVRNQKSKSRRAVKWQLLDFVNLDLVVTEKTEVYGIKESSYAFSGSDRYFDPYKLAISYFVAEVLLKIIVERNTTYLELFDFSLEQLAELDQNKNIAMFPISFLIELANLLGIKPKVEQGGLYFNLNEGAIEKMPRGLQTASGNEVLILAALLNNTQNGVQPSKTQRAIILQLLLDFYKYHWPNFIDLKSLSVLKEILN